MIDFATISDVIRLYSLMATPELRDLSNKGGKWLKLAGSLIVERFYGEEFSWEADQGSINFAVLSLLIDRLTVHQLTPGAAQRVRNTDLHSLPDEPPLLLKKPWIIEVKRPERETLLRDTVCLAGYFLEERGPAVGGAQAG